MAPLRFVLFATACSAAVAAPQAQAITLVDASFDIFVYGITAAQGIPPGGLLAFGGSDDPDGADGQLQVTQQIGTSSGGTPVIAQGGVADYGKTFYAIADSPNNFQNANIGNIGSAVEVLVYRDYVKDHVDDKLTFTYTNGLLSTSINPEFGPLCPPQSGDFICMSAGMLAEISVSNNGTEVWQRQDSASVFANTQLSYPFDYGVTGDLPWVAQKAAGAGGFIGMQLLMDAPATRSIDISGVGVGEVFTVEYQLFAYAYDRGSDLGLQRDASAFVKDPLGGLGGLGFQEISGGGGGGPTPAPVPLPASGGLALAGLAVLVAARRHRRAAR